MGDGNPGFYKGADGVIWALDYLHRIDATGVAADFRSVLPRLMERVDFESNAPAGYTKHGSLLRGDMGAALLVMRLAPTSSVADLVHTRAKANNELPIRELMWGMPGSMIAAIHMPEGGRICLRSLIGAGDDDLLGGLFAGEYAFIEILRLDRAGRSGS